MQQAVKAEEKAQFPIWTSPAMSQYSIYFFFFDVKILFLIFQRIPDYCNLKYFKIPYMFFLIYWTTI